MWSLNFIYYADACLSLSIPYSILILLLLLLWLVSAVMSMYTGAKTVVRTVYGNSNGFEVKVGMHQGSAFSPLLFVMVMEALS